MEKPDFWWGFFFDSIDSLPDWVKLLCKADVFCFVLIIPFRSLTCDFAGVFRESFCIVLIL